MDGPKKAYCAPVTRKNIVDGYDASGNYNAGHHEQY
jgi:hypothetical protein